MCDFLGNQHLSGDWAAADSLWRQPQDDFLQQKIELQHISGNLQAAWHGIKTMASINQYANDEKSSISLNGIDDLDLPDAFNSFFPTFLTMSPCLKVHWYLRTPLSYHRNVSQIYLKR